MRLKPPRVVSAASSFDKVSRYTKSESVRMNGYLLEMVASFILFSSL